MGASPYTGRLLHFPFWDTKKDPLAGGPRRQENDRLQVLLHPLLDAIQRYLQIFHRVGHAEAHVALAERSKRSARQPSDARLVEQRVGQLLGGPAGLRYVRES